MARSDSRRRSSVALLALLFASGTAGLAYEISWTRQLGLVFGQTARSAAIVLAAYFVGMALGYAIAGRLSAKVRRPLVGFAVAEAAVGLWAFVVPSFVALAPGSIDDTATRVVVALLVLLPGTTALGASLPFVARAAASLSPQAGTRGITGAYAANLAGAIFGVGVSSVWLLATLGVVATSWAAATVSLAVGLAAWRLAPRFEIDRPEPTPAETEAPTYSTTWIVAAAVSGLGTLAAQVLYMRLFSLVFHNSTYTFAAILAVVLLALTLSSVAAGWCMQRMDPRALMVGASAVAAVGLPTSSYLLVQVRGLRYFTMDGSFAAYIGGAAMLVASVVMVPVLAMGLLLPLSWELAGASARPGAVVGRLTTANTLAAALGALATSFVLLPTLDLWWSLAAIAAAYLALAVRLVVLLPTHRRQWGAGLILAAVVVAFVSSASARFEGLRSGEVLVKRFSGAYGWTDVTRDTERDNQHIRQNIHYGLGSRFSSAMELRQGHLPLLLHPAPKHVAFIGLATGVTASSALDHPEVERITVMELIPEVVEAARYFENENAGLLDDPRTQLVLGDGRHVLGSRSDRYDVIVADLFVPWESKTGYLYTVEHYRSVRERLADGGIFCQWLAGWQVGPIEFDIIAQSMQTAFEHVAIWQVSRKDQRPLFGLLGFDGAREVNRDRLAERMKHRRPPAVSRDYVLRNAFDVVAWYVGDWQSMPDVALNTDEHPIIEFSAPVTQWTRGQRLRNQGFWSYYDARLARLPRTAVSFDPPATEHERRRPR